MTEQHNDPADGPETEHVPTESDQAPQAADSTESDGSGQHRPERPDDEKWRQRFRQAEAQLAVAHARIDVNNQREAERHAAIVLSDPSDLWRDGVTADQLVGDDGLVDPQLVAEAAQQVAEQHPHWRRPSPVIGAPAHNVTADDPIPSRGSAPTWRELLGGNATG